MLNLYDDPEVWAALGCEGSSFDKGGYINRGFNDLDWLPEPRIEEYDGPVKFEPIWEGPGCRRQPTAAARQRPRGRRQRGRGQPQGDRCPTQQDPREGARPAGKNSQKASV